MTSSEKNRIILEQMQVLFYTGPSVRMSKRPLLASCTRCKYPTETSWNKVMASKTVIRYSSVISSRLGEMSDQ